MQCFLTNNSMLLNFYLSLVISPKNCTLTNIAMIVALISHYKEIRNKVNKRIGFSPYHYIEESSPMAFDIHGHPETYHP